MTVTGKETGPGEDGNTSETAVPDLTKLDEIRERGVLKVGTAGDYQPMSYLDPETGSYVGFDSELAEDLAATLGVEIEYVETSWPSLMADTHLPAFYYMLS